ncbi:MAG: hypothetical protein Q8R13_01565 [bacterium]|nr:hypothetical protein [bacterium]MDZ4296091.1 hypothetical protein [Patescibacteria group bacterium]
MAQGRKKVLCRACGGVCKGKKNPRRCSECGALMNLAVTSLNMRISGLPEKVVAEALRLSHQIGTYLMGEQRKKLNAFRAVPEEQGECTGCGKEKVMYLARAGDRYCVYCIEKMSCGDAARKEILPAAQRRFPQVTYLTLFQAIWNDSAELTVRWFKQNRRRFADLAAVRASIEERKAKARALAPRDGEPAELTFMRHCWMRSSQRLCPLKYFQNYALGQGRNPAVRKGHIDPHYRRKRRERLRRLNAKVPAVTKETLERYQSKKARKRPKRPITLTNLAYHLVAPICGDDCPNLVRYTWGWECRLHDPRAHPRPTRFPAFPKTIVPLWEETYELSEDSVKVGFWEKRRNRLVKYTGALRGKEWLASAHPGYASLPNTVYATFWRRGRRSSPYATRWKRKDGGIPETREYLGYQISEVIPVRPGGWTHVIACGPYSAVCWSRNGPQRRITYGHHRGILAFKEFYRGMNARARRDSWRYFFDVKRDREQQRVILHFHKESAEMVRAIEDLPGRVMLVHMHKRPLPRETFERKKINRLLNQWPEELFRQFVRYKAERAGFAVIERDCDLGRPALCPRCGERLAQSWQDLMVVQGIKNVQCGCGEDMSTLLALTQMAYWKPPPKKAKAKKGKGGEDEGDDNDEDEVQAVAAEEKEEEEGSE